MSCVSTDDPNFLPAGKKVVGHYMSGVAACSQYYIHKLTSMPRLDAGGAGLDSAEEQGSKTLDIARGDLRARCESKGVIHETGHHS